MNTHIRKAQLQDVAALTELLKSLDWFAYMASESSKMTCERITHHLTLCSADESHSIYVAEKDSGIVGYVAVHWLPYLFLPAPEGYISELFVCKSVRGRGIGTQLLEVVKAEAQERGCSRLMLVNSRSRYSYKRKFYERQGWKEREEIANFVYVLEQPTAQANNTAGEDWQNPGYVSAVLSCAQQERYKSIVSHLSG